MKPSSTPKTPQPSCTTSRRHSGGSESGHHWLSCTVDVLVLSWSWWKISFRHSRGLYPGGDRRSSEGATKSKIRTTAESPHNGFTFRNRTVRIAFPRGRGLCWQRCICTFKRACKLPPHYGTSPSLLRRFDAIQRGFSHACVAAGPDTSPEPRFLEFRWLPILEFIASVARESMEGCVGRSELPALYAVTPREPPNRTGISLYFYTLALRLLCHADRGEILMMVVRSDHPGNETNFGIETGEAGAWVCVTLQTASKRSEGTVHQYDRGKENKPKITRWEEERLRKSNTCR
jgi:hypothetical protein